MNIKTITIPSLAALLYLAACGSEPLAPETLTGSETRQHHLRFAGLWMLEQNTHATYEGTFYDFMASGTLVAGETFFSATGSVGNCPQTEMGYGECEPTITCAFGNSWHSLDAAHLVIASSCSDGLAREVHFSFNEDASSNSEWDNGSGSTLDSVGDDSNWAHDSGPLNLRKCPEDTDEAACR